ncbi:ATP-grasp domain-containing protein [Enterococcus sp. CWB-B31]|uniref:ATP-grasp domain-containing protein n=1 Tax=Enterococcus sp. CWB-B31 TaxID=2885159 RepID=UPI001E37C706|nr:ATP-grasp domain-containing protein [Enterococcus sp. CWB-B31]MCB5954632.1 ATP-grasp domain-containing protein [Enterococcus sp. CWB-B31]
MNILILSCGTRNKLVRYFKKEFSGVGEIIATDSSELAPALYEADRYYIVPKIEEEHYLEKILSICKKESISLVLTLIDPEISLISENKQLFEAIGCITLTSPKEVVDRSLDKLAMFKHLESLGIRTPKTYDSFQAVCKDINEDKIIFPLFVKPRMGSASSGISVIESERVLANLFEDNKEPTIVQEFMDGNEYGVDAYIDILSGELISIFIKKKLKMRAGETDKSVSIRNVELENFIIDFIEKSEYRGVIDIDVFEKDGFYYISEVNPRFGGGYPHAYECGVNFIEYIRINLEGRVNVVNIGNYEENVFMMKYSDVLIKRLKK